MTDSWYIIVDHTACPNHRDGKCDLYNDTKYRKCCWENCVMCIIDKDDLMKETRSEE